MYGQCNVLRRKVTTSLLGPKEGSSGYLQSRTAGSIAMHTVCIALTIIHVALPIVLLCNLLSITLHAYSIALQCAIHVHVYPQNASTHSIGLDYQQYYTEHSCYRYTVHVYHR